MSADIKPLPHSVEAEQSVLGALLVDNNAVDRIGDLRAEHFFVGDHAAVFTEIMRQIGAGKQTDLISVMVALTGKVADVGAYLNRMVQATPSSSNAARYAAIVRDKAIKRGLIAFGKDVAEEAYATPQEAAGLLDSATSRLEKLAEARMTDEPVRAGDDMVAHITEIESRYEGGTKAMSTGFDDIDKKLNGGVRAGNLIVLAGRPSMGKTALAMNIATNMARDYSVLFLSMEMKRSELHDRNLASIGKVRLDRIMEPRLMEQNDWANLTNATMRINELKLYLHHQGGMRLLDVRMKSKGIKRKRGLDILMIDYLQLMDGDGDNRNAQIETITRGLKSLAMELDIGIFVLSQLNRKVEDRPNKRPMMSDLRDSGAIEQDADVIMFPYRDERYNPDSLDKGICEVNFPKVRQGEPGTIALTYLGEYTKFENCARWQPSKPAERKPSRGLAEYL